MNQTDPTAAVWIDGDPLMEAIAAAVWDHCYTEGTSLVVDDPRNIAAVAAVAARSVVRAETLRDAEEICDEAGAVFTSKALSGEADGAYSLMERFRRKAEEAEQASAVVSPPTDRAALHARIAEVLWPLADWDGDRLRAEAAADAVLAVLPEPTDRAAVLTDAERQFLDFALDQAAEEMSLGDGFTDEDRAALETLRRLAAEAQQQPDTEAPRCDAGFVFGGRCTKPAGHRDPHATAPVAQQPAADGGPRCRYCGADCTDGRSYDGGGLYTCGPCSDARAARNRAEQQAAAATARAASCRCHSREGLTPQQHENDCPLA